ncbi:hypothetical protein PS624_03534 [Pseudomonas fluorescens]|uniref:Uncharacterized protein n=1 Tax=Pseudomonas fluorescens TaxID=294 RepID=A0A5E7WJA1_PSEFL|nr:hypothetical protein PS624_03534 [Pseudomonas fluorescens]VVQ35123.1 hypothetical protein PS947_04386 [Pseudomonas fluorescens]
MHSKEEPIALTTFMKPEQELDPLKVASRGAIKRQATVF